MANTGFTNDELSNIAHNLAAEHRVTGTSIKLPVKHLLNRDIRILTAICLKFCALQQARADIPIPGEWLVENNYLIEGQAQFVKQNFPAEFYRHLPVLKSGPSRGLYRIQAVLIHFLNHTDGKFELDQLLRFIKAYQEIHPLTMGELWAVPLMIRVAIIHQLRVIFEAISQATLPKRQAALWVKQIAPLLRVLPDTMNTILIKIEHLLDLTDPVVLTQLAREFRNSDDSGRYLRWLETRSAVQNLSLETLITEDNQRQIQYRITVGHLLSSLHQINHLLWEDSFEELSLVEQALRRDPAGIYPEMDFASRDAYRHQIEKLARRWNIPEPILAERVLALAAANNSVSGNTRIFGHVGHYLYAPGIRLLTQSSGKENPWTKIRERFVTSNTVYFSSLFCLIILFLYGVWHQMAALHIFSALGLSLITILFAIPATQWAARQLHQILYYFVKPQRLPKLEFRNGVPREHSTLVVVPTLINSVQSVTSLLHQLEIYHLANEDPHIYFALLTDFADTAEPEMPDDEKLVSLLVEGVSALNNRYPHPHGTYFFLMHRRKFCNPGEDVWMGWERKRGKLMELNALLLGDSTTSYEIIAGDRSVFPEIQYVITLDADTQLPRDAAVRLIGTIAHPLNAPVLDARQSKVVSGYGLLQPRISTSNASTNRSPYARLFGGKTGIDIYSGTLSDPYQDLFQYGIFTGKGIYDVKIFDRILRNRIPDNTILSHDLLEGGFLHAGLVTDVELFDDYPTSYLSNQKRIHRWVRGDWQLLPWLKTQTWNKACQMTPVPLSAVTRWQIMDNLFRSLNGPLLYILFWLGIIYIPGHPLTITLPFLFLAGLTVSVAAPSLLLNLKRNIMQLDSLWRLIFNFLVLPYHSLAMVDAIIRTLYRMSISHRHLLEWVSAADEGKRTPSSFSGVWRRLCGGQLVVAGSFGIACLLAPESWLFSTPVFLFWLSAPFWVYLISRPNRGPQFPLPPEDTLYLRDIARRTWHFFESVVGPEDHWLPPDNFQVYPANGPAHRTSPTNIGLYLGATVLACDMGYLTSTEMLHRISNTVDTLETLTRWHGHFYNWYDTKTLQPSQPEYISTVDSGNLLGYLIVTKQALDEALTRPLFDPQMINGILDTARWESGANRSPADSILTSIDVRSLSVCEWYRILKRLTAVTIKEKRTLESIQAQLDELEHFLPCLPLLAVPENPGIQEILRPENPDANHHELRTLNPGMINGIREKMKHIRNLKDILAWREELFANPELSMPATGAKNPMEIEMLRLLADSKARIEAVAVQAGSLRRKLDNIICSMDFKPLYDQRRHLFAIGYNLGNKQLDSFYYDLLASEARQTSFITIALGQVPTKHWFILGRPMTLVNGKPALVSWSGTMFEYFMPLLLMPAFPDTLWNQTYQMVVKRQINYARKLGIPWGISESGFNAYDFKYNYQYQAFGVPGLGLKPGLENDRVISPYSSLLAVSFAAARTVANLRHIQGNNALAEYGFYEAIDFTPKRQPDHTDHTVIRSYMAHHQGMIFLSLGNLLLKNIMARRFLSDPRMEATESLLREPVPEQAVILSQKPPEPDIQWFQDDVKELKIFRTSETLLPEARFLSNGKYLTMVSNSGGGFSQWGELAVTRWSEDPVCDSEGSFIYIRNQTNDTLWSPSYQPCRKAAADAVMSCFPDKIVFTRTDGDIHTQLRICVSAELDAEIRELTLTNQGETACTLEITSFLEPVLSSSAAYQAHPVYSRLFIETENYPDLEALLAHRRTDTKSENNPWLIHSVYVEGQVVGAPEFETDRSHFIGRGYSVNLPRAIQTNQPLSGNAGYVIDPILSLRRRVELLPGSKARLTFITGIAVSREKALAMAEQLRSSLQLQRTFELAWTRSQVELHYLSLTSQQANLFQWMSSRIFYFNPYRSQRTSFLTTNHKGQSGLWPYGISGDLPIVLLRLADPEELAFAKTVLRAHEYWHIKGLKVDLVILNDFQGSYEQPLQEALRHLIENSSERNNLDQPGGIFLRSGRLMPASDQILLETVARISLYGNGGNLEKQLQLSEELPPLPARWQFLLPPETGSNLLVTSPPENLFFFNDLGGFTASGEEYRITLKTRDLPPLPWINVISNSKFGFQISESGGSYTWSENSREYKLTPWSNDPVLDPPGEICYLRDEANGMVWTLAPSPIRDNHPYTVRHGQGYTVFAHTSQEIEQTGTYFVPLHDPVKIIKLSLYNTGNTMRRLSITYYLEWVLGVNRIQTAPFIITEIDPDTGALMARNVYQDAFPESFAFLQIYSNESDPAPDLNEPERSWTGDRSEFIGRNGSLSKPAALARKSLSNRTGALYNSCGAMQLKINLPAQADYTAIIIIGSAKSSGEMRNYLDSYRKLPAVESAYREVLNYWNELLGQVRVTTPDPGMNLLLNRWLLYQTLSCRLWSRSAFYQSGGAFGFRDQLQDSLALLFADPAITREQILKHAAHQFQAGDVQHWWHEETGYGIRTGFSDDLLWLPYVTLRYVEHTDDQGIWLESIPFLEGNPLPDSETELYGPTKISTEAGSLYEHCLRAIDRALRFGEHGLPLMGSGDWNDGMNRVGSEGKGESIWLGWFLYKICRDMIPVCIAQGDKEKAQTYQTAMNQLVGALNHSGWDGHWYRRAFFDNGEPLGSITNKECQIDAIAQAWAVISGAAPDDKALTAMNSLDEKLVAREHSLVHLLTPPFDNHLPTPGYIQAYPPGVRENGGQYTHGSVWAIIAWAILGEGNRAYELFHMLNPINHTRTYNEVQRYKAEPYVMAADVYSTPLYIGRGGWTWYTGAAGWMYQAGLEWILGLRKKGDNLYLNPCIPEDWPEYRIEYQYGQAKYRIIVKNPARKQTGGSSLELDGKIIPPDEPIPLKDDGKVHEVLLVL